MRDAGGTIAAYRSPDPGVNLGVNDRVDLARVAEEARRAPPRSAHARRRDDRSIPRATWIDADVEIAPDVVIEPGTLAARRHQRRLRQRRSARMTTLIDAEHRRAA